jgi:capsular exopolysaccharide synthesis family protein
MSQLERAISRARREGGGLTPVSTAESQATARRSAFVSAWDLDVDGKADEGRPARPEVASITERPPARRTGEQVRAVKRRDLLRNLSDAVREKLVIGEQAHPAMREQFRKLAASLYGLREQRRVKTVLVVSAVPGEGKTLTAANLALTLSESYRSRVLLVDADLRRPTLHLVFDIPNKIGLKEGLAEAAQGTLSPVSVSDHLEVLTAGSANIDPMGALTSERMRLVLSEATAAFDWVILDTPPVELLPDAKLLASMADVGILVVQAGSTKCGLAQRVVEALGRELIVGVVLNQVKDHISGVPGYYGCYAPATGDRTSLTGR